MTAIRALIAESDPTILASLVGSLRHDNAFHVITAQTVHGARTALESEPVDQVVCGQGFPDGDGIALLQELRRLRAHEQPAFVYLSPDPTPADRTRAWQAGADAVFSSPVAPGELRAALQSMVVRQRAARNGEEIGSLLHILLDSRAPAAGERGRELASAVSLLATRFEVPSPYLPSLLAAARLHNLSVLTRDCGGATLAQITAASAGLLRQVNTLEGVAELVEAMAANWDGSGHPSLQRGEIPLRSRLLRAVADWISLAEREGEIGALEQLSLQAGVKYDPAVVAEMHLLVGGPSRDGSQPPSTTMVPVDELRPSMVLAADLYTSSGVKLLAAGCVLSAQTITLVRERNLIDPLPHGARVFADGTIANRSTGR